jgi:hypothetical protein
MIIEVPILLDKKKNLNKLKNLMNNGGISTAGPPLVMLKMSCSCSNLESRL